MTAEQSKFAFERFWRADNTGNTPGTGLGLSVAKELAEKMNLTLEIDSIPGHGTSVTLTLPIMAS
jgi:signal transduction histidine kinase